MSKLRVAVIGCGGIANQKHLPALKNNSDLNEVVSFCDIIIERAEKAAAEFGVPGAQVTADYREVLANCGTLAGAEIRSGMSFTKNELIYNRGRNNQLMEETLSPVGSVAYFGGGGEEGTIDCRQWLEAVINGTYPLVKPEEALAVTRILDAIYKSAAANKEIRF